MNTRIVQSQNDHNNENQRKYLGREVSKYYYPSLYKRIDNSRHHVYYLTKYI
jgi:hypothetical protein